MKTENRHINFQEPEGMMLLRYIKDTASNEEKSYIEAWLEADENNKRILLQTARIYYANNAMERIASRDSLAAYRKVEGHISRSERSYWLRRVTAAVACIAAIVGLSTLVSYIWINSASKDVHSQFVSLQANAGMRSHFDLPDGTIVFLNSGSVLSYPVPYDPHERKVQLSGEAYFKVARDEKKPFIVSASEDRCRVRALGTEFNIQAYKEEDIISTTLVNGSVEVEVENEGGNLYTCKLQPSEKAVCNLKEGQIAVREVNIAYETAWIEGKLMFKDTPLSEVLRKLSYYYNVEFTVEDPVIKSYCLTGVLDNRQLSQTLDYLKLSSNIDYRIEEVDTDDSLGIRRTHVILWKKKKK